MSTPSIRKRIRLPHLHDMHARGEKIAVLTAYDATFAAVADAAGVDCLLVGDSLGTVCQGLDSTVAVTLEAMCYHTKNVAQGLLRSHSAAFLIADLPYGSYSEGAEQAIRSANALMQAGAHMVKLEGGGWTAPIVHFLVQRGIPVCAHLGLTPQSEHALGGYRVQGREENAAQLLQKQAVELQDAGAELMVLELVPSRLAVNITTALPRCPTIGIGAGQGTAGQVLVLHDMLGLRLVGQAPKFVHNFMSDAPDISHAIQAYVQAVKSKRFPIDALHAW